MQDEDRRQFPRVVVKRPAKVLCEATQRYLPAVTVDVSLGGMLVMSPGRQALPAGTSVMVGVAAHKTDPLIRRDTMRPAKVVRSAMTDHGTYTALELNEALVEQADHSVAA